MPNPVPPPVNGETYCVIICIPGPLDKAKYMAFNTEVKALAEKNQGKVTQAKVESSQKK
jgi:hypothetical protein